MSTTVAIVEDNAALAASLRRVLIDSGDCQWVGTSLTAGDALRAIPRQSPDVVIMDIELPDFSGIECTARLKQIDPELHILILTVYNDNRKIFDALAAGASGYLLKRASPEEIVRAVRDVKEGGCPMSAEIARKVVQSFQRPSTAAQAAMAALTVRESEILALLAKGYTSKEIAEQLGISHRTVCGHLGKIYEKLHVRSRTEAVLKFLGA